MKVGILTFHDTTNYGAVLQAFALQKVIRDRFSCECETIDYSCTKLEKRELAQPPKLSINIRSFVSKYLVYKGRIKKKENMKSFETKIIKSQKYGPSNIGEAAKNYDKIFVGSDIVWEPSVTDGDLNYYLNFVPNEKRYSYAASFGNENIPENLKDICGMLLKKYQAISVREKSGVDLVEKLSGRVAEWVLDPTLLLQSDEWDKICNYVPPKKNYIFLYFLDKEGYILQCAKELSRETGKEIVLLHEGNKPVQGVNNIRNCSVEEFLGWIKNSDVVMTASYHGLLFAINYGREFYYYNRAHAERMKSLSEMLGLGLFELRHGEKFKRVQPDYKLISNRLSIERNKSLGYLDACFKNSNGGISIMNVSIIAKADCCGCTGCKSVCPVNAIKMIPDSEGFLYPEINENCIDCGMCLKVCNHINVSESFNVKAYAAKNNNDNVLKKSSSGGMSNAFCEKIISAGGIVYGVAYEDDYSVDTVRAETYEECEKFYGSKYVQTDLKDVFSNILTDLSLGKNVLFLGTSCHVAGLHSFLEEKNCETTKLYTIDIICHGVPSPKIFADYIQWLGKDLTSYEFRTKNKPWGYGSRNFGCTIVEAPKGRKEQVEVDTVRSRVFLNLFFSNNCLRPCCYNCNFTDINKPSDITIADYWGLKEIHPEFFDEKGVSAVIVHTSKGERLFKALEKISYIETSVESIAKRQGNLHESSTEPRSRDDFWNLYNEQGFAAIAEKYGGWNLKNRLRKSQLYMKVQSMIKRLLA